MSHTATLYRLQCNGAEPGRVLTAGQAARELENLRAGDQLGKLTGNLETGVTWTGKFGAGRARRFTITPIDEDT